MRSAHGTHCGAVNAPDPGSNATSLTVFDAKGQPVALTFYYQRATAYDEALAAVDSWNVYVTANGTTTAQCSKLSGMVLNGSFRKGT